MSKGSTGTKLQLRNDSIALLQGRIEVSATAVQRQLAAIGAKTKAAFSEQWKIRQEAAKYRSIMEGPTAKPPADRQRAIQGLRSITDRLAKRKLAIPASPRRMPGILAGSYTIVVTPPYFQAAHDVFDDLGGLSVQSSADASTGQMSCDVLALSVPSAGCADASLALYFAPMFGPALLRVRPELNISFSWSANSLGTIASISGASGLIRVYLDDSLQVIGQSEFLEWSVLATDELEFDFGTFSSLSSSLDVPVTTGHYYLVVLSLQCFALAPGWPSGAASSSASMSVPSVTLEVDYQPTIAP